MHHGRMEEKREMISSFSALVRKTEQPDIKLLTSYSIYALEEKGFFFLLFFYFGQLFHLLPARNAVDHNCCLWHAKYLVANEYFWKMLINPFLLVMCSLCAYGSL